MQTVTWSGQGEGTITSPYILNVATGFTTQQPFNILITGNYIDSQKEINYFKFSNSMTIYVLAHILSNRDSLMYINTSNAIKVTMFLTDKNNYIDGPYIVTSYSGIQYILKQQVFDPLQAEADGSYRGLWVSKTDYRVNDTVVYDGFLYICIEANYDTYFTQSKWLNLSGQKKVITNRDPLPSDYNHEIGTLWINTNGFTHFILVNADNNIAVWNLGSIRADEVTLSVNGDSQLEIKERTIEGGEW